MWRRRARDRAQRVPQTASPWRRRSAGRRPECVTWRRRARGRARPVPPIALPWMEPRVAMAMRARKAISAPAESAAEPPTVAMIIWRARATAVTAMAGAHTRRRRETASSLEPVTCLALSIRRIPARFVRREPVRPRGATTRDHATTMRASPERRVVAENAAAVRPTSARHSTNATWRVRAIPRRVVRTPWAI